MQNGAITFQKSLAVFKMLDTELSSDSAVLVLGIYQEN